MNQPKTHVKTDIGAAVRVFFAVPIVWYLLCLVMMAPFALMIEFGLITP